MDSSCTKNLDSWVQEYQKETLGEGLGAKIFWRDSAVKSKAA
jgi:hypothetical protein